MKNSRFDPLLVGCQKFINNLPGLFAQPATMDPSPDSADATRRLACKRRILMQLLSIP